MGEIVQLRTDARPRDRTPEPQYDEAAEDRAADDRAEKLCTDWVMGELKWLLGRRDLSEVLFFLECAKTSCKHWWDEREPKD